MKPVHQTIFGDSGNCLVACIASILELPLEKIPHWKNPDVWYEQVNHGLKQYGVCLLTVPVRFKDGTRYQPPDDVICIAGGVTPRSPKRGHAVVWLNGRMIHDPHPSGVGLKGEPGDYTFILQHNPARGK